MYGYLKTRPCMRTTDFQNKTERKKPEVEDQRQRAPNRNTSVNTIDSNNPQSTGYLSWESISYFFGLWATSNGGPKAPSTGKLLEKTQVDSHISKPLVRHSPETRSMDYTVTSYDTLPKIALKFDVTPSELTRLNRLAIRTLYPGQILRVPCPKPTDNCAECEDVITTDFPPKTTIDMNPVHVCKTPVAKRVSFEDIDSDVLETFIKISSKYITDGQGVVKGVLLITPHAVIFNPDVSEVLVVDRGAEYYRIQFPMDSVCAAGIFDDIASMVIHDALQPGHLFLEKPVMMWLGESDDTPESPKENSNNGNSTLHTSLSTSRDESDDTVQSITDTMENFSMDSSDVPNTDATSSQAKIVADILNDVLEQVDEKIAGDGRKCTAVQETSLESHSEDVISSSHQRLRNDENHHPLPSDTEQLSSYVASAGQAHSTPKLKPYKEPGEERHVKGNNEDSEGHSISTDSGIDEHLSRENADGDSSFTDKHHSNSKAWLKDLKTKQGHGMIDVQMNSLPIGIVNEKIVDPACVSSEVIPRLSTNYLDMPKYLCVKIKRACWPGLRPQLCRYAHESIQRANDERREFWFSIPCDRLLEVYSFFLELCPAIHEGENNDEPSDGEKDLVGSCDYSVITMSDMDDAGLILVDDFYPSSPSKKLKKKWPSRGKKNKKKSENKESLRKASSWSTCSIEELLPEIIGKSEILTETDILQLSRDLPSRTIGHSWRLIYSTYIHGTSLKTLYRALADYDAPALMVIVDDSRKVFGVFASSTFVVSDHFYGTGECFLYSFYPELRVFRWSGENHFFIKGDTDSLAFGGGEGNFGLWLDEDLYHGSSHRCKTFDNEPLTVAEDFLCSGVEIWCFE